MQENKHLSSANICKYNPISQEILHDDHLLLLLPEGSEKLKDAMIGYVWVENRGKFVMIFFMFQSI